jgi:NAD dependent epimerase/dehydratase
MELTYKNILVTGADGFIGSHLTEALLLKGYKVKALAQYNSFNYWGWLEEFSNHPSLEIVTGDIRDSNFCKVLCKDIDLIFHLAALIAIPYSYLAPNSYVDTNIIGTLNICQAAKECGNIRIINTSTSEVYGTALYVPIDEKHPKQAQSPYSASKIGADAMAMSFFNSFNLPVTTVRPFNTYGPRQSARAIIPTIITQIASGVKQIKVGDLSPTRDFNYVLDIVHGFIAVSECDELIGQEVNICSNFEISIADTLNLIRNEMSTDVEFVVDENRLRPSNSEVFRLWGDNTKLFEKSGFRTKFTIKEGIKETCVWFSKGDNLAKYKSTIYNV